MNIQNKGKFAVAILGITTFLLLTTVVSANGLTCGCGDICVNESGWWRGDFNASTTPIQAAVDNATAGETICVQNGNYNENVVVNKSVTIQSESGSANCVVRASDIYKDVFNVTESYVNISGFTVRYANSSNKAGIYLNGVEHCTILNNTVSNNNYGIYLVSSSNYNNLMGNTASNNFRGIFLDSSSNYNLTNNTASNNSYGIYLVASSNYNNLTGNIVNLNTYLGIYLGSSSNNNLTNNTANSDNQEGIRLRSSSNNTLAGNTASNNFRGIFLDSSSNYNNLTGNTLNLNNANGIDLSSSSNNTLAGNTASDNALGIHLQNADNNNLTGNTANDNEYVGIHLQNADNNNLTGNTANDNGREGIYLFVSDDNNLTGNTANDNGYYGVHLSGSQNNTLLDNFAAGHKSLDLGPESFDVFLLTGASWTDQGELSFSNYETLELPMTHDAGTFTLRLTQHGHDSAYVDYVALKKGDSLYEPATAVNLETSADIRYKILDPEYDVCDAWNSTLELTWDSVPADTTLIMRAMEEDLGPGHGSPLYYPLLREGRTLSHTLVNDGGITVDGSLNESGEPDFSVFWRPDTPHPDGYTYGWVHADDQYVYAAVEVTGDNTPDEGDWGALFIMVNDELREFRVAPAETTWGQIGFQYTSAVPYEHRIYEFAIPLSVLNAQLGDELRYGFGAYGTFAVNYVGIGLEESDNNNLTGNRVTDNNFGIYLNNASWNNITCNAVYKNTQAGFYLREDSENNTIALNGIVANGWPAFRDEEEEGYNFENDQTVAVNATYNYWGTNVSAEIAARIYDNDDDVNLGKVTYEPFLYAWPLCAPSLPVLEVTKTVWNGSAWVKSLNASRGKTVRFNCTITNIGAVNLTQLRFWDILDCSLVYAGNATLRIPGDEITINLNETPYNQSPYNYTFKQRVLHPNTTWGEGDSPLPGYLWDPYVPLGEHFWKNAVSPIFEELCPEDKLHYLHGWNDTDNDGRVSACDQLWLESYEEWYHVDHVPYTLLVNNTATNESMYLDSVLDYEALNLSEPNGTAWTEVCWLEACCGRDRYTLENWTDNSSSPDGNLSANDTITLRNEQTSNVTEYTVTELAKDIVVSMEWEVDHLINNSRFTTSQPLVGALAPETDQNSFIVTGPIAPLNLFVLEPGQLIKIEYNATVIRCGVDNNTFVAKGAYEGNWTYSNEEVVTITVPCATPSGEATDPGGFAKEVYTLGEPVYAVGSGFEANKNVSIYIIPFQQLVGGENLETLKIVGPVNVTTDGNGDIGPVLIWPDPVPGHYLIVFDDPNGEYDPDSDPLDEFSVVGAVPVVTPFGIVALIGLLSIVAISTLIRRKKR
jgi:parallel beta-helix repeat protein